MPVALSVLLFISVVVGFGAAENVSEWREFEPID